VEEEVLEPEEHEKTKTGDKKTKQEKNNNPTVNDNKADAECE
jgi:hypothetical protein